MKKYIREMIDDLRGKSTKDYVPEIPKPSTQAPEIDLNATQDAVVPTDLENQELSDDQLERIRQLDFQAQQSEERQGS
jgi:hypothetical protein